MWKYCLQHVWAVLGNGNYMFDFLSFSWLISSVSVSLRERLYHRAIEPWPGIPVINDYNWKAVTWLCARCCPVLWFGNQCRPLKRVSRHVFLNNVLPGEWYQRNMHVGACVCIRVWLGQRFTGCRSIDELHHQDSSTSPSKLDYITADIKCARFVFPAHKCWLISYIMLHLIQLCYLTLTRIFRKESVIWHVQGKNSWNITPQGKKDVFSVSVESSFSIRR